MTLRDEHVTLDSGVELHLRVHEPASPTFVPWLLVHGLASNAQTWDGVANRLAAKGHPVVAVDQRGHGTSSKPDAGYDMATVADDLALLIDHLGWDRPAVAGQSWGGNVVVELASRHRSITSMIACVDGGYIRLRDRFPEWDEAVAVLSPPPLVGVPVARIEDWLATAAADWPEEGRAGTLANFEIRDDRTVAPRLTLDRHLKVLRGLWEHDPEARMHDIEVPVLFVLADTGDVEWTRSKEAAVDATATAATSAEVRWFRPAHHDVHAQRPDDVAHLLHEASTSPSFWDAGAR